MRPKNPLGWALCAFALALPLSIAGANIGWALALAALILTIRCSGNPTLSLPATALTAPLISYCLVAALSGALGTSPHESFSHFHQDLHKLWLALLFTAILREEPGRRPLLPLAAGCSAAALLGILQALPSRLSGNVLAPWDMVRAHAFVHPVTFGEQMAIALMGATAFALAPAKRLPLTISAALGTLFAGALILSGTRGAVLGAAAGLGTILLVSPRWRRWALVGAAVIIAALVAIDLWVPDRSFILEALRLSHPTSLGGGQLARFTLWEVALRMGMDHPWLGVGPNCFRSQLPRYVTMQFEDRSNSWGTAHNLYLHHFAERGLIGLAVTLWLMWTLVADAWRRARRGDDPWQTWALGASVAFAVMNLTEVALQVEIVWMLVWFVWLWAEARDLAGETADGD